MSVVQTAMSAEEAGRHREAGLLYEQAFALSGGDPALLFMAARERANAGETNRALQDLAAVVRAGWPHVEALENDSAFIPLRETPRWKQLISEARTRYPAFDGSLRQELLELAEEDQRNRAGLDAVIGMHGRKSPEADSAFAEMERRDEPFQRRLQEIVAEHGWPGRSRVADDGAHAFWLLVQHAEPAFQERVLPSVIAAAESGEARTSDAAFLLDRVLMHRGEPQIYGAQMRFTPETGQPELYPIANEAKVDERRAAVLLEPLSEYLKQHGIAYSAPEGQDVAPPSPQNPSPMVETTRAHTRVRPNEVPLRTIDAGLPVSLFIAESAAPGDVNLLIHFMGAEYVPVHAVRTAGTHVVLAVVNLGSGSGAFERPFREEGSFARLLEAVRAAAAVELGGPAHFRRIDLSAFSAGYGAVRAILSEHADQINGILLLDALHTGYAPERTVLSEGGRLDSTLLAPFVRFAERAAAGEKTFVLTHSEIFPGTFASTTETADYLVRKLGLERTPVLKWGPGGMQQLSEARAGRLLVLGFAGNTAPDHVDHLHGMSGFLPLLSAW